ncbi:hypothetical protein Tsubulata_007431 [Turnera subulata]|uniref:Uncharacterized protein n=1 Tax=Turnera subulata TaxID=218843 RepID=A0A9Q0F2V7_9ROSI|nr:hypothetical protein Tsubulata_007431 [Turnera subulata]
MKRRRRREAEVSRLVVVGSRLVTVEEVNKLALVVVVGSRLAVEVSKLALVLAMVGVVIELVPVLAMVGVRMISFNELVMLPMLLGMQPVNSLLAITIAEAGEDPIVSGMLDENLLLFKKIASRSLRKSSGGNSPSNSLNRISRKNATHPVRAQMNQGYIRQ